MLWINRIIILSYYAFLFVLCDQEIIQNPIMISGKEFNPINYILILQNNTVKTISSKILVVKNDYIKLFHKSYIFAQPFFLCNIESNNFSILVKDKYYEVNLSNETIIEKVLLKKNLKEDIKYLGYMIDNELNKVNNKNLKKIIFYGISNSSLVFYSLKNDEYYSIKIENIDEQISCKLLKLDIYTCVLEANNEIKILIFSLLNSKIESLKSEKVNKFGGYKNVILYDTSVSLTKILCAQKKETNYTECIAININLIIDQNINIKQSSSNSDNTFEIIELKNDYNLLFSYQEDNCNFTIFNSEYLVCCGKKDYIFCDRRDMNLNLTNNFTINLKGKISNLTFENSTEYIKILYSNKNDNEINIYEYFIFPPVCHNIQITITSYQKEKVNISNLFERKTNTNYYISFDNLPINFATFQINDNIINNNDKILIEDIENYLYIISQDGTEIKNYTINFNISIEETYSKGCEISLNIEPCYHS